MNLLQETTQEAVWGLDRCPAPAMLFGLDGKILGANAEASSLFTPLRSRDDLPAALTTELGEAFSNDRRRFSCCHAHSRTWRRALYPEYLDPQRLHQPTSVRLKLETKAGRTTPESIAVTRASEASPIASHASLPAEMPVLGPQTWGAEHAEKACQ